MSEKIRDIHTSLPEKVDLSDSINKSIKISKGTKMKDLREDLRHLKLRKERTIKLSKLSQRQLDPITKNTTGKINTNNEETHILKTIFSKRTSLQGKIKALKKDSLGPILLGVVLIAFLGVLDKILLETTIRNGYQHLLNIKDQGTDIKSIESEILSAKLNLYIAKILHLPISFIPHPQIQNAGDLINGGIASTYLAQDSIGVYKTANKLVSKNKIEEINFIEFLSEIEKNKDSISKNLYNSLSHYNRVKNLPNKELQKKFLTGRNILNTSYETLNIFDNNYDTLKNIFGNFEERKYLIALQNNDEIRPSGGFTGSFGILTLENGKIKEFETKDVYAFEWKIDKVYTEPIVAPRGLQNITDTFHLRDANYYIEIADSAKKIDDFLSMINYKIDGILFINQNTIKELLEIVGGVDSQKLGYYIDDENFSETISTITEAEITKKGTLGTPKQGLFDFAGEFYTKLLSEKKYSQYVATILRDIQKRDIVFYSFHPEENSLLWKLGINGNINYKDTIDFNYPIYTSIAGNKSDRYIVYDYEKHIQKVGSCNYQTKLSIYNEHSFDNIDELRIRKMLSKYKDTGKDKKNIVDIQGKGENKSFLRVLVPIDAAIEVQEGQTISQTPFYQVVDLYTVTQAGKKSKYDIKYSLYNPECKKYSYKFYKQPGIEKYDISFFVNSVFTDYKNITTDFLYNRDKKINNN